FNDWKLSGAVNAVLVDNVLAVRVAYEHWNRDGYATSRVTGEHLGNSHDDDIARLSVTYNPTDRLRSITKVEYGIQRSTGVPFRLISAVGFNGLTGSNNANLQSILNTGQPISYWFSPSPDSLSTPPGQFAETKAFQVGEDVTVNLTDSLKLRSITG